MDEIKNVPQQQGGKNENGGRRRRHHNKHKGGENKNNAQAQNQNQSQNQPQNTQGKKQAQNQNPNQNASKKENRDNRDNRENRKQGGQPQAQKQQNVQNVQGNGNNNKVKKQNNQPQKQQNKDENRKDTYLYTLDGNLYVNLTNKCSNGCDFCVRNERTSYYGNYLWLRHGEPTVEKVIAAANGMGDLTRFKEAVFCGFGEPTYKVEEMLALCDFFHEKGLKTRLNTNGQGNLINKRDITPELKGKLDFVNVSLNASCYEKYQPMCRSQFREAGFAGLVEFAKLCKRNGVPCRFSIVDCIGEDEVEACKRLAQSVNVPLYIRNYITDS